MHLYTLLIDRKIHLFFYEDLGESFSCVIGSPNSLIILCGSVHDKQLVDDIPLEKLLIHDVPVDIICTPTQVILTNTSIPKPQGLKWVCLFLFIDLQYWIDKFSISNKAGIYWEKLSPEKLGQIRILRELKKRIEQQTGQALPCGPSEKLPPTAQRRRWCEICFYFILFYF